MAVPREIWQRLRTRLALAWRAVLRRVFPGDRVHDNPNYTRVHPNTQKNRELVTRAYWRAVAHLESVQHGWGHLHRIHRVVIRPGVLKPGGQWVIPTRRSPLGFLPGWCTKTKIVLASDVEGNVDVRLATQMWARAILAHSGVPQHEQDAVISRAGC